MAGRYATDTTVPSDRSRAEIERTLSRYGSTAFAYATERGRAQIAFEIAGRRIILRMPLPDPEADEFRLTPSKKWERFADDQFLAHIAIPGGTVGEWLRPKLDEVYNGHELPALMPGGAR